MVSMIESEHRNWLLQPLIVLRSYTWLKLRRDAFAGLTVAVVAIPQSMAYALIAGVPPVYGLYTLIIQSFLGALFNSNPFLSVGPVNTQSLLVASTIYGVFGPPEKDPQVYLQLVIGLTLLKGIFQLAFAFARLSKLVRYVSQSVIVGFTSGAGVLIIAGQLPHFLGIPISSSTSGYPGIIDKIIVIWPQIHQVQMMPLLLGTSVLILVIAVRAVSRLMPGPLMGIIAAAVIVYLAGWSPAEVPTIEPLGGALPGLQIPQISWKQVEMLIGGAIALAVLGLMEAYCVGRTIAVRSETRINAAQELTSQGVTNFVSSFFNCIPGSGSFSRSSLNFFAGAATLYSGVFNSAFCALIVLMFASQARYIPLTSLAAVLFVIGYSLINWRYITRIFRNNRIDAAVCATTFVATLVLPLQYAIYFGVFLNLALYLRQASRLHFNEMMLLESGKFAECRPESPARDSEIIMAQLEGDLFFGVADELSDHLEELARRDPKVMLLRVRRTRYVDATCLEVLEQFQERFQNKGGTMILVGLTHEFQQQLTRSRLAERIGQENLFPSDDQIFGAATKAIHRARKLIALGEQNSEMRNIGE